jgi:hypothetical protein
VAGRAAAPGGGGHCGPNSGVGCGDVVRLGGGGSSSGYQRRS